MEVLVDPQGPHLRSFPSLPANFAHVFIIAACLEKLISISPISPFKTHSKLSTSMIPYGHQ